MKTELENACRRVDEADVENCGGPLFDAMAVFDEFNERETSCLHLSPEVEMVLEAHFRRHNPRLPQFHSLREAVKPFGVSLLFDAPRFSVE